jgi:hypothetical protein
VFDVSWLEVSLFVGAVLVLPALAWAVAVSIPRRLRARRRPRGWDEHVLGRDPDRSRKGPGAGAG